MTISTGAKSRLISFELGAREAQGSTIPPVVASDGLRRCRAYRSLVVGLATSFLQSNCLRRRSIDHQNRSHLLGRTWHQLPYLRFLFCALQTAGENDNSEIGYLNEE